jgi:hypothetical protein
VQVEQDEIRAQPDVQRANLPRILRGGHVLVAGLLEHPRQHPDVRHLVIDDEHARILEEFSHPRVA